MATHRGGQFINKLLIVSLLSAREYLKLEYKLKAPFMATQDVRVYRSSKIYTCAVPKAFFLSEVHTSPQFTQNYLTSLKESRYETFYLPNGFQLHTILKLLMIPS